MELLEVEPHVGKLLVALVKLDHLVLVALVPQPLQRVDGVRVLVFEECGPEELQLGVEDGAPVLARHFALEFQLDAAVELGCAQRAEADRAEVVGHGDEIRKGVGLGLLEGPPEVQQTGENALYFFVVDLLYPAVAHVEQEMLDFAVGFRNHPAGHSLVLGLVPK